MEILPSRIAIILEYLQSGGKVKMDGKTYVWLDNKVVNETEKYIYTIDGLAIEGRMYRPGEDWEDPNAGKPHYMGTTDMTLVHFFNLTNNIDRKEFSRVCTDLFKMRMEASNKRIFD